MPDITMRVDETLELDEIIEEWSRSDSNLSFNGDKDSFNLSGIQTKTSIINPQQPGTYTITVNGRELSVEVIGTNAIPDSAVSRWEFEQDVTDSLGNNDWTNNTSAGFTTNSEVGTYAKDFDGSDDKLRLGSIIPEESSWTLTVWVYTDFTNTEVLYLTDVDNADPRGFSFNISNTGNLNLFDGNNVKETTAQITTNNWQFVAISKGESGSLTIDVDGVKEEFNASFNATTNGLAFGMRQGGFSDNPYGGFIDDGRYYDKKLSDSELDNLRTTGSI